ARGGPGVRPARLRDSRNTRGARCDRLAPDRTRKRRQNPRVMTNDRFPTVGILGGGQLGRMLALAGIRMGINIRFLAPDEAGPMAGLGEQIVGDWEDPDVLRNFAEGCTVVTSESEWA